MSDVSIPPVPLHIRPAAPSTRRPTLLTGYPAALILLLLLYALGLFATLSKSATVDEPAHIVGGYVHFTLGQPRIHTENGYLTQAIVAFPLLFTHPRLDTSTDAFKHADIFLLGREFLFRSGNNPDQILLLARAMVGLLTLLSALVLYAWARKLFSPAAGILSLLLFAFSPLVLAHGFLATSDMPVTAFFLLSLASSWLTLQTLTLPRLLLSGLLLGALFLCKMSAPLILPVLLFLALLRTFDRIPLHCRLGRTHRALTTRPAKAAATLTLLALQCLIAFTVIWAAYGFTYSAFKGSPPNSGQTFSPANGWSWALASPAPTLRAVSFARDHRLFPEAYLYGYAYVAQLSQDHHVFLNGSFQQGAWWFYPALFLATTPIPLLLLAAFIATLAYLRIRSQYQKPSASLRKAAYRIAPLLAFFVLYWLTVLPNYRAATGPRHLLPAYPMLCIFLGAAAMWRTHYTALKKILLTLLTLWFLAESLSVYPHNICYFNEFIGGPSQGYRYFSDSAVDWGQDLPALSQYLRTHNPDHLPVYFSYFGNAEPAHYGIDARPLPSYISQASEDDPARVKPLTPGLYCISTSIFSEAPNVMSTPPAPMSKVLPMVQFLHLIAHLQNQKPIAQPGNSINIYHLSAADLAHDLATPAP